MSDLPEELFDSHAVWMESGNVQSRDVVTVLDAVVRIIRKRTQAEADLRARLSLEQRDAPRQRGYSMIDDDSGQPKQGELP